jgi:hypothetical protein
MSRVEYQPFSFCMLDLIQLTGLTSSYVSVVCWVSWSEQGQSIHVAFRGANRQLHTSARIDLMQHEAVVFLADIFKSVFFVQYLL